MLYNLYYRTDTKHLIKQNVTKEEAREWLKGISLAERCHCEIEEVEEKHLTNENEWER